MEGFRETCTMSSIDNFQILDFSLLEINLKNVDFTLAEFLHKKINNKDLYVDYGATEDIPEDACSLKQYGDLAVL